MSRVADASLSRPESAATVSLQTEQEMRALAADARQHGYFEVARTITNLLDACEQAYERLQAGDVMGAKLTLGWHRGR